MVVYQSVLFSIMCIWPFLPTTTSISLKSSSFRIRNISQQGLLQKICTDPASSSAITTITNIRHLRYMLGEKKNSIHTRIITHNHRNAHITSCKWWEWERERGCFAIIPRCIWHILWYAHFCSFSSKTLIDTLHIDFDHPTPAPNTFFSINYMHARVIRYALKFTA